MGQSSKLSNHFKSKEKKSEDIEMQEVPKDAELPKELERLSKVYPILLGDINNGGDLLKNDPIFTVLKDFKKMDPKTFEKFIKDGTNKKDLQDLINMISDSLQKLSNEKLSDTPKFQRLCVVANAIFNVAPTMMPKDNKMFYSRCIKFGSELNREYNKESQAYKKDVSNMTIVEKPSFNFKRENVKGIETIKNNFKNFLKTAHTGARLVKKTVKSKAKGLF